MNFISTITLPEGFNLWQTLDCGQCFRFKKDENDIISGVALGKYVNLNQDGNILKADCDEAFLKEKLCDFLDLNLDYKAICDILCKDKTLSQAIKYAGGIRILNQPHWETLCSFIISQNNNIKRIGGIIERLCENFGDDIGGGHFSFPSAERLASLSEADLAPIRCGFRAKYIIDAAQKVASGKVDFNVIASSDTCKAREMLMSIKGVGPKVADCTLLFGFHKLDAFPKDVWIKKALEKYYPDGFPEFAKPYGGIAQQFLFHYIRTGE